MENPKDKIYSILQKIASEMSWEGLSFKVERPSDQKNGDFASNFAMSAYRALAYATDSHVPGGKKPGIIMAAGKKTSTGTYPDPTALAKDIAQRIQKLEIDIFDKVEAVAPGFINFYLSKDYLAKQIQKIIEEGDAYGTSSLGKGKKASVEFVSANPTGPLHIGNARGGPLGDTIANVLTKVGFKVIREYLHNDVGGQVDRLGEAIYFQIDPDKKPEDAEVQYQGEYIKELAEEIGKKLSKESISEPEFAKKAGAIAVELMLDEILKDCEVIGIKFDKVTKESELRKQIPNVLAKIKKSLKENEGALWFAPNDEYLKDRETVVQKSDGEYTYFASDIVYHNQKFEGKNDLVVDILGANHSGHVPKLFAIVSALGFDSKNLKVILYQWIRLKRGEEIVKMSKRAGTFVTAREVLDEVGKDAFRFFLLMQNANTHMDFDLDLAKKKASENPVFYVQYAYTRICSIFAKAGDSNFEDVGLSLLKTDEELRLIRHLINFPSLVEDVSQSFTVNLLVNYAIETASLFHKFYEANQVISEDKKLTSARLALLKATQITLKNTLDLLGVSAPEKM